jgi:60 kDa SS-A/Ro ribonucleoprotein
MKDSFMSYASLVAVRGVPQTERLNARQSANNGGGFSFVLDVWARLDRFLILGSDAATYYESARKLTRENAAVVEECWKTDFRRTADRIVEISVAGRAPKASPAVFALALGTLAEDVRARQAALDAVQHVCRTGTHLFEFASICDALGRGWGRGLKRAVQNWYESRPVDSLGYQMSKYRSRHGYDHSRLISRTRPSAKDGAAGRVALYRWAVGNSLDGHVLPEVVVGHLQAMKAETVQDLVPLIERHRLTWEAVPTWSLADRKVWEALLPNLKLEAVVRNLGRMTSLGVLRTLSGDNGFVAGRLSDAEEIRRSRLHPFTILQALAVYRSGRAVKGEMTWNPVPTIVSALENAFYLAFANVVPTGKRHYLSLDVSGSMTAHMIGGVLSARQASAAMAMVTARTEANYGFFGFNHRAAPLAITANDSLSGVIREIDDNRFDGGTDCALPMLHALQNGIETDVFVIYTDNETNWTSMHPSVALQKYRRETGIDAKLVVAGMTATGFSIADPMDSGMLDVVGFDSSAVSVIADFVRG